MASKRSILLRLILLPPLLLVLSMLVMEEVRGGEEQIQASFATVTYLKGKGETQRAGRSTWEPVALKTMLKEGDRVRTLDATRLELTLQDRSVIRFAEKTTFILVQLKSNPNKKESHTRISLLLGKIWANLNKITAPSSTFKIQTQTAIAGTRDTIYRLSLLEDNSTTIKVYEGSIQVIPAPQEVGPPAEGSAPHEVSGPAEIPPPYHEVSMEEWMEIVGAMEQITISPQGKPGKREKITTEVGEEEWVAWNQDKDRVIGK